MKTLLHRREFFALGGAALAAGIARPAFAAIGGADVRALKLANIHTGEKLSVDYWADGGYVPDALHAVNKVMRDYRNGQLHDIDKNLLDLVHLLQKSLGSTGEIEIISGYRSPATNAAMHAKSSGVATHSLHMEGMAMDIRIPGVALDRLHKAALAMQAGGVGYYPASDFVHVDVGRVRRW